MEQLRTEFLLSLERYVRVVFFDQLEPKSVLGRDLTAPELLSFASAWAKAFGDARRFPEARVLFNATSRCADAHVLARLIGDGVSVVSIVRILNAAAAAATLSSAASDDDANHWHWAMCVLYNLLAKSLHAKESRDQEVAVFLHAGVVECLVTALDAESFKSATKARARHALFYLSLVSDAAKGRILAACPHFFEDFQLAAAGPAASTGSAATEAAALASRSILEN